MKGQKTLFSSKTDDWKTPTKIYNYFMKLGCIDCFKYKSVEDEFKKNYENQLLFINPPFSKMKEVTTWVEKQIKYSNIIYLLIPARTDTQYFHKLLDLNPTIYFIKGRLHYNDSKSAPFPTILMIITNDKQTIPYYKSIKQENIEAKNI